MFKFTVRRLIINVFLVLAIVGVLMVYSFTVSDLPERIYTPAQRDFLSYNSGNMIAQNAPTFNFLSPDGAALPPDVLRIMPASESHVRADLKARYEEQQGVTVTVYDLDFHGEYHLVGPDVAAVEVELVFPFPENLETLHDVRFTVDNAEVPGAQYTTKAISWRTTLQSGETHRVDISYKASGAQNFTYGLPHSQRASIDVVINVAGLSGSSIPRTSLPLTKNAPTEGGETFTWGYAGLIANRDIQLTLPTRLSFAQRIAGLQDDFRALAGMAPFLVGAFIACLAGLFFLNGLRVPLEGYLLAGLAMALFYPLLTFSSGLIGVLPAVGVTLLITSGLMFGFLGLIAGWAKTWRPLAILLLIFAGFFSLAVLTPWRGLLWTGGGLLLLVALMWAYIRRPVSVSAPEPEEAEPEPPETEDGTYCAHCGRELEDVYTFCPGCGHDIRAIRRCDDCGSRQLIPSTADPAYCVSCGNRLA